MIYDDLRGFGHSHRSRPAAAGAGCPSEAFSLPKIAINCWRHRSLPDLADTEPPCPRSSQRQADSVAHWVVPRQADHEPRQRSTRSLSFATNDPSSMVNVTIAEITLPRGRGCRSPSR